MALPTVSTITSLGKATSTFLNSIKAMLDWRFDPPHVHVYNASGQAVGTQTLCLWPDEIEDWTPNAMHSQVSNTSRITIPEDGRYLVNYFAVNAAATVNITQVRISKNANGTYAGGAVIRTENFNIPNVKWPFVVRLAAGDYIEAFITTASATSMGTPSLSYGMQVDWIGK